MYLIPTESPLKILSIGHENLAISDFVVMRQFALISNKSTLVMFPVVINVCVKIAIIKVLSHFLDIIVVDFTFSMEFALVPLAVVGDSAVFVVENSLAVHCVVSPHTFVVSAIFIEKSTETVSLLAFHIPMVSSSVLILLFDID